MKLVLFDIDGTLIRTHGIGKTLMAEACSEIAGVPLDASAVVFSGRTDPAIVSDILRLGGIDAKEQARFIPACLDRYMSLASARMATRAVEPCLGVIELLEALQRHPSVHLGIVTGNLERAAHLKLERAGLSAYRWIAGGFGSDHRDRNRLPRMAVNRYTHTTGRKPRGHDVVVLGDTAADIVCAHDGGYRAVAVATGHYDMDHLRGHGPDALLADLSQRQDVFEAIGL